MKNSGGPIDRYENSLLFQDESPLEYKMRLIFEFQI